MNENESASIGRAGGYDDEPDCGQSTTSSSFVPQKAAEEPQDANEHASIGRAGGVDDEPAVSMPSAMTTPDNTIVALPLAKSDAAKAEKPDAATSSWIIGAGWIVFWGALSWIAFQVISIVVATVGLPFIFRWPALAAEAAILGFAVIWFIRVVGFLAGFRKQRDTAIYAYYKRLGKTETFAKQIPEEERAERLKEVEYLSVRRENLQQDWETRRKAFEEKREIIARGIVQEHAVLTAVKTATSPWKAVDIIAVFYNSTRMVERIAKLYGHSCGRSQAFRLVCRWAFNLYVAGELGEVMEAGAKMTAAKAAECLGKEGAGVAWLGSVLPVAGKFFAKAGEGAANYYFCYRLGRNAITAFAPDPDPDSWESHDKMSKGAIWAIAIAALFAAWFIAVGLFMLVGPAKGCQEGKVLQTAPAITPDITQGDDGGPIPD